VVGEDREVNPRITIGDRVTVSPGVMILTSTHELDIREHRAGAVVLAIVTFSVSAATHTAINWSQPAWWLFIAGGALGTVYVTSAVVLTPQIGAAAVMGLAVTGQLLAGLVVDKTGFLGAPMHEITLGRVGGAALLVAGAVMIRLL